MQRLSDKVTLKEIMSVNLPPPPSKLSLREWFAGLAIGNPELMRGVAPENRIKEALRIADQLAAALNEPKTPSRESLAPQPGMGVPSVAPPMPTASERPTSHDLKRKATITNSIVPPDPNRKTIAPPTQRSECTYSVITPNQSFKPRGVK